MVRLAFILLLTQFLQADAQTSCLNCHQKNQIPNELIYKRYLMKYSTKEYMKEAIVAYLKNPNKKNSIMPSVFFSKFPMKEAIKKDKKDLEKDIFEYLDKFDVKKRLVLK
jgi:hypothetical protein